MSEFWASSIAVKEDVFALFNKTKEQVDEDVAILQEWLKKQSHIPEIQDTKMLELILLRNKFRIEQSKIKIDKYYSVKNKYSNLFEEMDPFRQEFMDVEKFCYILLMSKLTPKYERVQYFGFFNTENEEYRKIYTFKYQLMVMCALADFRMHNDYAASEILILDMAELSFFHLTAIEPILLAKIAEIYLQGFSGRLTAIHIINGPTFIDTLVRIIKGVLPAKIQDRMMVHSDLESLYKFVPKENLPKDLGGLELTRHEIHSNMWSLLKRERENIVTRNFQKSFEHLRIESTNDGQYGIEGTFKKINID